MGGSMMTPPMEPGSPLDGGIRKRVCKACDRCRLKKSKCDGSSPCSRCKADNAICVFGERKKSHDKVYPKGYVEMLENQQAQLVTGLQELYKRMHSGQGWTGSPLKESGGVPLTHDILERLGALKQDGHNTSDAFEEDLNALQQRLIASGATMMQREASHDGSSESAPSPAYDPAPQHPHFTNPFALNQFPPTPPNRSPYPQAARTALPVKSNTYPLQTTQSNLSWSTVPPDFDDNVDFINQFDSPMMDNNNMDMSQYPMHMFQDANSINPFFTMKDWSGQDDMQRYVNPAMI